MLCTLLTDFGGHYPAALKGAMYCEVPDLLIVDIAHNLVAGDWRAAAFIARTVCFNYPLGTLHFIAIDSSIGKGFWVAGCQEQIFILPQGAGLQMITQGKTLDFLRIIPEPTEISPSFAAKAYFVAFLRYFCTTKSAAMVGTEAKPYENLPGLHPHISEREIRGSVIFIDTHGNAITNIPSIALMGRRFEIWAGIERLTRLYAHYGERNAGEAIAIANESGLLEIAVIYGNASQLLGLKVDSAIIVKFI